MNLGVEGRFLTARFNALTCLSSLLNAMSSRLGVGRLEIQAKFLENLGYESGNDVGDYCKAKQQG
jgi:hypothetical protein